MTCKPASRPTLLTLPHITDSIPPSTPLVHTQLNREAEHAFCYAGEYTYAHQKDETVRLHAESMSDYITKPINRDVLLSTITKHLKASRSLREANINLGHLYRDFSYDGKPYDDGTSYGSYNGAEYNLRPNHDFLEDKLWFEMAETRK